MLGFHSDAEIYSDGNFLYTNTLTIQFGLTVIDLPDGQTETLVDAIPVQFAALRAKLINLRAKYGFFKLVKVVASAKPGDIRRTNRRTGFSVTVPDLSQIFALKFENPVPADSLIAEMEDMPEIINVKGPRLYRKLLAPNDEKYAQGLQWGLSAVSAPQAWDLTTGGTNIKIALVDEGVNQNHQDLLGKFAGGTGGSGEHGTWVAGVAGAQTNNSIGVASLGWNIRLTNYDWDLIDPVDAIYRAGDSSDVINMSWGSFRFADLEEIPVTCPNPSKWIYPNAIFPAIVPDPDALLQQAINYALQQGVVCVASAGNASEN